MIPPVSPSIITALLAQIDGCTGTNPLLDQQIDQEIAKQLGLPSALAYSASLPDCQTLITRIYPTGHFHIGFDASGILPYVSLTVDHGHFEAKAATLPLAALKVLLQSLKPLSKQA